MEKIDYWDKKHTRIYKPMVRNHTLIWDYVKDFIEEKKIGSILEIGAGAISPIKDIVSDYQAIDVNINTPAIHDDFTTMDTSPFVGKYDLVAGLGVIEHCDGYENFINQVIKCKPKYAIISFFNDLNREENIFAMCTRDPLGEFHWNRYSYSKLASYLSGLNLKFSIIRKRKRDIILVIDFT